MRAARPTVKDVAALAGVSPKTVSNVLTGTVAVRAATRERVEEAMRRLDFVPNLSARGLRSGRTGTIAVSLPDLSTVFSAELLHHLVEVAHERGFAVQIEETAAAPERERDLVSRAREHLVDGLVLNPIRLEDSAALRDESLPPIVLIGEVEQQRADRVLIDSRVAAREVTAHLIAQGARRIAAIGGDDRDEMATATSRLRLAGYRDALVAAGIAPDPLLEVNLLPWGMAAGADATRTLLQRGVAFDGVVAFTDSIAMGVLSQLERAGMRVPDDVLVSGFDDVEVSRYTTPSLTTVAFDRRRFAEETLGLLQARIADRSAPPRSVTVPHELVIRRSSGRG